MPKAKPRYFSYSYPGELGTQEIPGIIEFFPRQVEFGATKTVKNPASGGGFGGIGFCVASILGTISSLDMF